jgi:hypothetical protein
MGQHAEKLEVPEILQAEKQAGEQAGKFGKQS